MGVEEAAEDDGVVGRESGKVPGYAVGEGRWGGGGE